ncbi:type II secretion system protein [Rubellicoccus peritrichatus]|uniref:Type II secretion system protein n=1 Tax=Rubellicoccus peritrichatus TaxID=3080537 RepID=A0AAQ3LCW7_9BACT|nr:type II secretion system protein [Puniceicoccus sp. CR14]WOO43385.1 type II secretion system protein [Puniceicoccus sp. CR14]
MMKSYKEMKRQEGFTLIELLTVVAIIGILAGILIPVVSSASDSALKAKARVQFTQYATALQQYHSEYGYWPDVGGLRATNGDGTADLSTDSRNFIEALTGRNPSTGNKSTAFNRKAIPFMSFSENEFEEGSDTQLADPFGNTAIQIVVDADGDGQLTGLPNVDGIGSTIKGKVAVYSEANGNTDYEDIYTWN